MVSDEPMQYSFEAEVQERGLMRLRRRKERKGAIIVLVATGMVVILMSSCLVLDYILYKTAGMRLKNSCELAQISANLAAGGAPANPNDPNDPWVKTAKRILLGNGVTPEEIAAATIKVREDGTVEMIVPRKVDLIHPHLWPGKSTATASVMQEPPKANEEKEDENQQQPYEGYDEQGRYIARNPQQKPEEAQQKPADFVVASGQDNALQKQTPTRDRNPRVIRPNGVGNWFEEAPPWWTPPVQHEDVEEDEDLDKFKEPVQTRVYRPKGLGGLRLDGSNWYFSGEWIAND